MGNITGVGRTDYPAVGGNPAAGFNREAFEFYNVGQVIDDDEVIASMVGVYQIESDDVHNGYRFSIPPYRAMTPTDPTGLAWFSHRARLQQFDDRDGGKDSFGVTLFFKTVFLEPGVNWNYGDLETEQAYLFNNGKDYYSDTVAALRGLYAAELVEKEAQGITVTDHGVLSFLIMV